MNWPQWTVIILLVLGVGVSLALDGKERSPHSFLTTLVSALINWWLLWMGGFFSG